MNWAMEQRQKFITEHLQKHKQFNRSDIMDRFGVTLSCAATDIRRWLVDNENKAVYNKKTKRYEAVDAN